MLNRLRKRPAVTTRGLAAIAAVGRRPDLAAADRTEEAAALLYVNHTALALGRCR